MTLTLEYIMKRVLLLSVLFIVYTPSFAQSVYYSQNASHSGEIATAAALLASSMGGTATAFDSGVNAAQVSALANGDVIFIGQSSETNNIDAPTRTNIASWVSTGGVLLTLRDTDNIALANDLLGTSMSLLPSNWNDPDDEAFKAPQAAGTSFDSAPASLPPLNDYAAINPATMSEAGYPVYADQFDAVHVMVQPLGSGFVSYFSWDWCCGDTPQDRADWDAALYSAAVFSDEVGATSAIPTLNEWTMLLLASLILIGGAVGIHNYRT